ncbi:RagB/SusD family nutrient uptake outer membrane protein [Pedobacter metabolipauper]|nr:RagB/SusD family nutrient uptake outer membrane protein [Pedobacter metabolipauper]
MKKYIACFFFVWCGISQFSCKKFLDVKPLDKLTGNNFYQNKEDVEAVINDMSRMMFDKFNETQFVGATGEYRSGEVKHEPASDGGPIRRCVEIAGTNNLLELMSNGTWNNTYHFERITQWMTYYKIIQAANILVFKLNEGIPALSAVETKQYLGEAKFARCLAYFFMVRLYGDVVYYTDAYHIEALPRESMVSVFNKCIADLKSNMNDMPWGFSDPAQKGVRASRGSIIALIMNMNMWNAGFDGSNATKYWRETAEMGDVLIKSNAYRLLPLTEWAVVARGRSDESLFELFRTVNYGDYVWPGAPISDMFIHFPYKQPQSRFQLSYAYYKAEYMQKIFPETDPDKRKDAWFQNMYANTGEFLLLKVAMNKYTEGTEDNNPENTFQIFRYADAILLRAEALANLNEDVDALTALNMVRKRADAPNYIGTGQELKDFIFNERSRELFGEGVLYFDLIRTKRILTRTWTSNPLTLDQFNRGGWTWPIDGAARDNNPFMVLNTYWTNGGI